MKQVGLVAMWVGWWCVAVAGAEPGAGAAPAAGGAAGGGGNLLANADFAARGDAGLPTGWKVGKGQTVGVDAGQAPPGAGQSLKVEVAADGGSAYGQVYQTVKAKPGTLYRLEGRTRSTKAGMAFLSVKLLKGGHEGKRVGLAKSQQAWTASDLEFSSEDADEIQVLCRWEQNAQRGWVGQTCWFADLKLVEKGAAPPPPPWTVAIRRAAEVRPAEAGAPQPNAAGGDLFVTPDGAGKRDGSGWENALPGNAPGVLQAAWDALPPGKACRVGSGVYVGVALKVATGGTGPDKLKTLRGQDTGGGLPWFVGDWQPGAPEKGATLLGLTDEVDYCAFQDLQVARYQYAAFSRKGRHVGLRFRNLDVYESRYGFYLLGFAYADEAPAASHDMEIRDCDFVHFTKSGIRLQAGNYDVRIINCVADAGGTDWMKESFQICFNVQGDHPRRQNARDDKPWASEHDILFVNCVARNAIWSKARYWQGDGFLVEGDMRNIAFINCQSYDNADGGWDCKASNVVYVNCVGMRNKMNFRVWQHGFFYNCLSAYSGKKGGSWTGSGLWTTGDTRAARSTFHNNDARNLCADSKQRGDKPEPDTGRILLERCISSADGANANTEQLHVGDERITKVDTAVWRPAGAKEPAVGEDPRYVGAALAKGWTGTAADAFDSVRYGTERGYHSSVSAAWNGKTPEQLVDIARALLKHTGWEDFERRVEALTGERRP